MASRFESGRGYQAEKMPNQRSVKKAPAKRRGQPRGQSGVQRPSPRDQIQLVQAANQWHVNAFPIMAAFEMLTGFHPLGVEATVRPEIREAYLVVNKAITAVVIAGGENRRWLATAAKSVAMTRTQRLAYALDVVNEIGPEETPDRVRQALSLTDTAFTKLNDAQIATAAKLRKPGRTRGATNYGPASVAAELALACGAFGLKRKPTEHDVAARERVAKIFNKAARETTLAAV
jgi:hypothetical protein